MFIEHQIRILECFLKNHVTLKTRVMMPKSFSFAITEINYIFKYIKTENSHFTFYSFYCIFDQINVALFTIRDFQKC